MKFETRIGMQWELLGLIGKQWDAVGKLHSPVSYLCKRKQTSLICRYVPQCPAICCDNYNPHFPAIVSLHA